MDKKDMIYGFIFGEKDKPYLGYRPVKTLLDFQDKFGSILNDTDAESLYYDYDAFLDEKFSDDNTPYFYNGYIEFEPDSFTLDYFKFEITEKGAQFLKKYTRETVICFPHEKRYFLLIEGFIYQSYLFEKEYVLTKKGDN